MATVPPPSLGGTLRRAAWDLYFHSLRLVAANLAWGVAVLIWLGLLFVVPPIVVLVLAPLLCLPLVGLFRLAALIARGDEVVLSDVASAIRAFWKPALVTGAILTVTTVVFSTNVALGIALGGAVGGVVATLAAWGLIVSAVLALVIWPLIVDPRRETIPATARARLGGLVVLAAPGRIALLSLVAAVILAVSTAAFIAVLSVSLAYVAVLAARYVLPMADALDARLAGGSQAGH